MGEFIGSKVQQGISSSTYFLVVLSQASKNKPWPLAELNIAIAQQISADKHRILPLIVCATEKERAELLNSFTLLQEKRYLQWTGDPKAIVRELQRLRKT